MPASGSHGQPADVVVVGGGTVGGGRPSCSPRPGRPVVLVEARHAGRRGQQPRGGHGARSGRHRGRDPARPVQPRLLRRAARPLPARLAASSRRAISCRASPTPRSPRPTTASRCSAPRARRRVARCRRARRAATRAWHTGVALGASFAAGDGYLEAPRNVLAYTAALVALRVDVREHCAFAGLRTDGSRVDRRRDGRRPDRRRPRRAHRRPGPRRRRARRRRAHPRRRHPPPGRRHRAACRSTSTSTRCRWPSTWPPASTGGRARRAACSGA